MSSLHEFNSHLNELLTSIETAIDCIDSCNHKVSDIHERFTGILTDRILLPIDEQHTFLEHSHEELARFHALLTDLIREIALVEINELPLLYGPPSSFDGDDEIMFY